MLTLKKLYYEKYSKKSYSLSNIDVVIDYMFKDIKKGIYIDIGCNHPIKYNNTYLLHKRGWCGINVDADKTSIKLFKEYRKNDHNIRSIVSNNTDIKKLYYYHDRSAINTLSKELVDKRSTKPQKIIEEKSITLNMIIENSPFKDKKINFLTIDIEGHEHNVLKNFNFSKYKIDLIVVEFLEKKLDIVEIFYQSIDSVIKSNIYNLLTKNDYKLVNWIHSDLIFVRNDFKGM
tara:strand:- start:112 stop:807 length:696 start_codon:yes stop_codon:yes gene_type:complete